MGAGLAGLNTAYYAARFGKVTIITTDSSKESNSWLAQGGIAAAISEEDSFESHSDDTLNAGREICDPEVVNILVREGRERILELIKNGMEFDKYKNRFSLGREGGHSIRRVIHAEGSATGRALIKFLQKQISNNPNIQTLHNTEAIELVKNGNRIIGLYALNNESNAVINISSKVTILTSGGYSNLYQRSTNCRTALGQGISLAYSKGAEIKDMEFIQFHPTAFYSNTGESFLISEAVRGEGAYLLNENLERFMLGKHELCELAPRDIISKAIFHEIQNSNINHVYLDLRHLDSKYIKNRFPNIYKYGLQNGIDITKDLIPIAPAAHYSIGGIHTDISGATNLDGLYACGEVTSTGVHGANRLASNSLLECLVFSKRVVDFANQEITANLITIDEEELQFSSDSSLLYFKLHRKIQKLFTNKVGIMRSKKLLREAMSEVNFLINLHKKKNNDIYQIKINGLLDIASVIIRAALARKESRGTHQRIDYPNTSKIYLGNYIIKNSELKFKESKWKLKKSI